MNGQLIASIVATIIGAVYLFHAIKIADFIMRLNIQMNYKIWNKSMYGSYSSKSKNREVKPKKIWLYFGRSVVMAQALILFYCGIRGLVLNLFGV